MKTLNTVLKKTVIASLLLTSMTSFATDHSGDGRSGDDQSGISIPIQVDHLLTLNTLENAYKICRDSELLDILSQILRIDLRQYNNQTSHSHPLSSFMAISTQTESGTKTIGLDIQANKYMDENGFDIFMSTGIKADLIARRFATYIVSPDVFKLFETIVQKSIVASFKGGSRINIAWDKNQTFDELGSTIKETIVIKSITLTTDNDIYRTTGKLISKKLNIKVSREDFKQCLEEQLAK